MGSQDCFSPHFKTISKCHKAIPYVSVSVGVVGITCVPFRSWLKNTFDEQRQIIKHVCARNNID